MYQEKQFVIDVVVTSNDSACRSTTDGSDRKVQQQNWIFVASAQFKTYSLCSNARNSDSNRPSINAASFRLSIRDIVVVTVLRVKQRQIAKEPFVSTSLQFTLLFATTHAIGVAVDEIGPKQLGELQNRPVLHVKRRHKMPLIGRDVGAREHDVRRRLWSLCVARTPITLYTQKSNLSHKTTVNVSRVQEKRKFQCKLRPLRTDRRAAPSAAATGRAPPPTRQKRPRYVSCA